VAILRAYPVARSTQNYARSCHKLALVVGLEVNTPSAADLSVGRREKDVAELASYYRPL